MTDARLPGRWLMNMKIAALSDRAWRVFTSALMWSTEQGTDGEIPALALRYLYPMDIPASVIDELVDADLVDRRDDGGFNVRDWGTTQSTKAEIDQYREQGRLRKQRERARKKARVTPDVAADVTRDVTRESPRQGKGLGKGSATYGNASDEHGDSATSWPVVAIPNSGAA